MYLKRLREDKAQMSTVVASQAYRRPLEMVSAVKYLGRVLTSSDDDWKEVVKHMRKVWRRCARLKMILGWEGSYPHTSGTFYKVVVQETLLFGAETNIHAWC